MALVFFRRPPGPELRGVLRVRARRSLRNRSQRFDPPLGAGAGGARAQPQRQTGGARGAVGWRSRAGRKNGGAARQAHVGRTRATWRARRQGAGKTLPLGVAGGQRAKRGNRQDGRENERQGDGHGAGLRAGVARRVCERAQRAGGQRGPGPRNGKRHAGHSPACVGFPPQVTPRVRRAARFPLFSLIR